MPAFVFLSVIALFSFFAFEPPEPVTIQETGPDVVVAVVHEGREAGADAWLRRRGSEPTSLPDAEFIPRLPASADESDGSRDGSGEGGEDVAAEVRDEAPVEEVAGEEGAFEIEIQAEEGGREVEEVAEEGSEGSEVSDVSDVGEVVDIPESEPQPEIPTMTPEEAIPVPVLVLPEGMEEAAATEVPAQEVTEENLIQLLQQAAE